MSDGSGADCLDAIEIETGDEPAFTVIWLHGLGADGNDFVPLVPQLSLPQATRFVFPHAPVRPVTINGGYRLRAWYDILALDRFATEDAAGIVASAEALRALVARERARGVPPKRIVVAGFSQGGAIALYTALHGREKYAGVLALSTYLPLSGELQAPGRKVNTSAPIMMAHGWQDPVIAITMGERARDQMVAAGADVDWRAYNMPHSVCPEQVRDISAWLAARQQAAQGRFG